jgi:hypothetical protein
MGWRHRIGNLKAALAASPIASSPRTDLPHEAVALAERSAASPALRHRLVELSQRGEMRRSPQDAPLLFTAHQVTAVAELGFLWRARFSVMGIPAVEVIDYLVDGEGGLEGRAFGVFPIVRLVGTAEAFRAEAIRYLGELMWNPDAILFNPRLEWQVLDRMVLSVAAGDGPRRGEVRLFLDEAGDGVRVEADDRPRLEGKGFTRCAWFGRGWDYRTIGGRRIPSRAEAGWIVEGEEFVYWRATVESWRSGD